MTGNGPAGNGALAVHLIACAPPEHQVSRGLTAMGNRVIGGQGKSDDDRNPLRSLVNPRAAIR